MSSVPFTTAVPCDGSEMIVTRTTEPLRACPRLTWTVVLNGTVIESGVDPGGGGGITLIDTVEMFDVPPGPVAEYVNESGPT